MKSLILILALAITGCATFSSMEKGLDKLNGKNISEAFQLLGYPSGKQTFGQDTVYVWSNNQQGTMYMPQTATTSGLVGNTYYSGQTSYNQAVPVNYNCEIKIVATESGTIKNWQYNGNRGGCSNYISTLSKYAEN